MQEPRKRRSYIRRKRALVECARVIENALREMMLVTRTPITSQGIAQTALQYAKDVEAGCWSPRLQKTDEEYRAMILAKADQLCKALFTKQFMPMALAPAPKTKVVKPAVVTPVPPPFTAPPPAMPFVQPAGPDSLDLGLQSGVAFGQGGSEIDEATEDAFSLWTSNPSDPPNSPQTFPGFR